ncbi:hypothetical protein JW887_05555 [Candidatus Dojkabacteria bacterium]|nr:hypothetical protein [Candidatus Dojkabacteria bacterium]
MNLPKYPTERQDNRLIVAVTDVSVRFSLIISDYVTGDSLVTSDYVRIPTDFSLSLLDSLCAKFLKNWVREVDWKFINEDNSLIRPMQEDGLGVTEAFLLVCPKFYQKDFYSNVLGVRSVLYNDSSKSKEIIRIRELLEVDDLVVVDLGWDDIDVFHLGNNTNAQDSVVDSIKEYHSKFVSDIDNLLPLISNTLSVNINSQELDNFLHNVMKDPVLNCSSVDVKDIFRSLLTLKLIKIKDSEFNKLGRDGLRAALLITGDLTKILSNELIFLSVIDGLQLRGNFDVIFDNDENFINGSVVLNPELKKDFICSIKRLFNPSIKYLTCEGGNDSNIGSVCFKGHINFKEDNNISYKELTLLPDDKRTPSMEPILGVFGDFYTMNIHEAEYVKFRPQNGAFFPSLNGSNSEFSLSFKNPCDKLVIDCRESPIVYGPGIMQNRSRLSRWLNNLNLSY